LYLALPEGGSSPTTRFYSSLSIVCRLLSPPPSSEGCEHILPLFRPQHLDSLPPRLTASPYTTVLFNSFLFLESPLQSRCIASPLRPISAPSPFFFLGFLFGEGLYSPLQAGFYLLLFIEKPKGPPPGPSLFTPRMFFQREGVFFLVLVHPGRRPTFILPPLSPSRFRSLKLTVQLVSAPTMLSPSSIKPGTQASPHPYSR